MRRRRATTLVELIVCMAAGSSLMLVAIGMVHQTLTVSRQASQQTDHHRSLTRLSTVFRHDAHRATAATSDSQQELRLKQDDQTEVIYRFVDRQITRQHELASGQVENESFAFAEPYSANFQMLTEPERVELLIERDTGLHNVPRRLELQVIAALNKLPRAEQGGEEAGP